ncbi:hypothetical protein GCM10010193_06780 [Kitasatospora atroaurantiaca]|uniref:Integral membrane protein n=1 Tax=Kitasatospora atroaurantiaca TaxID=285545 RepID=A0A561EJ71_9ACTN|nr:hypothetical protein [Kitasatospora atroaurantiaca]TWE15643.1 hypothetical protein FB465_0565 [Kitasatospora atroaurantiaca]
MAMSPRGRKLVLTAHVTTSVGWLGAVAVFLALAVAGLTSRDTELVRAAYLVMGLTGWYVIVPLCFASLMTGVISSLGTTWGLLRYYWVVVKLLITGLSTVVLLVHMQPIGYIAAVAARPGLFRSDLHGLRVQLVVQSGAALLVLLVATALSVYKPQGRTRHGRRRQHGGRRLPVRRLLLGHWGARLCPDHPVIFLAEDVVVSNHAGLTARGRPGSGGWGDHQGTEVAGRGPPPRLVVGGRQRAHTTKVIILSPWPRSRT